MNGEESKAICPVDSEGLDFRHRHRTWLCDVSGEFLVICMGFSRVF